MASILIQINIFLLLISISSPAVWITKINKFISETLFFYFIFNTNLETAIFCDSRLVLGGFLLATHYMPSNTAHRIGDGVLQGILTNCKVNKYFNVLISIFRHREHLCIDDQLS